MRQWISFPLGGGMRSGFSWRVRRGSARGCLTLIALFFAGCLALAHPWLLIIPAAMLVIHLATRWS